MKLQVVLALVSTAMLAMVTWDMLPSGRFHAIGMSSGSSKSPSTLKVTKTTDYS